MARIIVVFLLLSACARFPALEQVATPGIDTAPFPDLVPLEQLLQGPLPTTSPQVVAGIEGRVAGLRARAAGLRGPVVSAETRARMRRGVGPV